MAVILIDGFDVYNGTGTANGLRSKWVPLGDALNLSMITGRFGGQALQVVGDAGGQHLVGRGFTAATSFSFGFAVNTEVTNSYSSGAIIAHLTSGSTPMLGVVLGSTNKLRAVRNSSDTVTWTVLGTAANSLSAGWHYVECEITVDDTAGVFNVYVDGAAVISLSSVDTRNGTPTQCDTLYFGVGTPFGGVGTPPTADFDDFYLTNVATKLGERRVETLYATADVAQGFARSAGSANYSLVNELHSDGDTTYVQGSNVGDVDTYSFGSLSSTPISIDAVQISAFARKTDAATRDIALQVKSGATTSDGSNFALASSYGKFERLLTTDPNTSAGWTASAVNALQAGPKVTI
jgi:hypothetical protein